MIKQIIQNEQVVKLEYPEDTDELRSRLKYQVIYKNQIKKGKATIKSSTKLEDFKKKLLQKLQYSQQQFQKAHLQIMICLGAYTEYFVTIESDANFQYLVKRQLQSESTQPIVFQILNVSDSQFNSRKHYQKKMVEFDSEGQLEQDMGLDIITPAMLPIPSKLNKKCAFCQKNQNQKENTKLCGKMYGPFGKGYCHLLCLIWCPQVFLTEEGELKEVENAIERSKRLFCHKCGVKGAGLGCSYQKCQTTTHYLCTVTAGYQMDWKTYTFFCSQKCRNKAQSRMISTQNPNPARRRNINRHYLIQDQNQNNNPKQEAEKRSGMIIQERVEDRIKEQNCAQQQIKKEEPRNSSIKFAPEYYLFE